MKRLGWLLTLCGCAIAADRNIIITDPVIVRTIKDRYIALTDSRVRGIDYTSAEKVIGIVSGPALHTVDASLMKDFHFSERKFVQFRWEAFNAFNEVNLGNPVLNIGQANTGIGLVPA